MRIFTWLFLLLLGMQSSPDRVRAFVEAFNSKDEAKLRTMIDANFAPSMFQSRKPAEWATLLKRIAGDLAPLTVGKKLVDRESLVVVEIGSKGGEGMGIRFDLESGEPHRIIGLRFGTARDLADIPENTDFSGYQDLAGLARSVREANKVPAIAIATWRDGKIEAAVDGVREIGKPSKVTPADLWLVGSIGKSMTSTLIGMLIDEGKLTWDSKLGDLLKDTPMLAEYREVTVEQIMRHRGGIPQDQTLDGATVMRIAGKLTDPVEIRAAYAKDVLARKPIGKPGEKYAYSNAGYSLLGHIAERIAGEPFERLLSSRVFKTIGMESALVGMPGAEGMPSGNGQPHGHLKRAGGPEPYVLDGVVVPMFTPAGVGIACTIQDLAKYAAWHMRGFNGEKIDLRTETVRRLHTAPSEVKPGETVYAAGWVLSSGVTPSPFHGHNGSDGTFTAEMAFWPKEKLVAVAIVNVGMSISPSPGMQALLSIYRKMFREDDGGERGIRLLPALGSGRP